MVYRVLTQLKFAAAFALFVLVAPSASFATTKQVSQDFGTSFTYFAQSGDAGVIFSNGSFYESAQPSVAVDWDNVSIDADRSDSLTPAVAVPFKNYNYVISGPTVNDQSSTDVNPTEILRMKRTSPTALTTVFTMPAAEGDAINQLRDLVAFHGALYASDSEGRVWKSRNGTSWKELAVSGLPENASLDNLSASDDMLYGVYLQTVYQSSNGKTWEEVEGNYQNFTYGGGVAVAELNGSAYISTYTTDDYYARLWKVKKNGSTTLLFTSSSDNHYSLFTDEQTLYLIEDDDSNDQFVVRTLKNKKMKKEYTGDGMVRGVVESNGKTLFIVLEGTNTYLLRYAK